MHGFMACVHVSVRERPETSLRVVLEVELLIAEGSHMDIARGRKYQTWTERDGEQSG